MRSRSCVISLLAILSLAVPAVAQYRFESWTADRGLPQNIITGLHQASDGYLWIATLDGLARFDGVRFTVFNKANSTGIQSNRFTSLYADRRGDLWLTTEPGSVTRYSNHRFVTYTTAHGLSASVAWGVTGDDAGNLWVLSGEQIVRWDPAHERFNTVSGPPISRGYGIMTWSARGGFWAIAPEGLRRFVGGTFELYPIPEAAKTAGHYCAEDQDGRLFLAAADGRTVYVGTRTSGGAHEWKAIASDPSALRMTWRTSPARSWSVDLSTILHRSITLSSSAGPHTVPYTAILEDRDGNLWLGTDGDGLYAVRKEGVTTYSEAQGLVGRNVYPIIEGHDGAIWIGAWSGGISRYQHGTFTNYTPKDGLAPAGVTALHEDRDGRLWIATNAGGLQTFQHGRFASADPRLVPAGSVVKAIHQDRGGAIWFGTQYGVVRHQQGVSTVFSSRDGVAGDDVRVIVESRHADRLWFGTYAGLTRWQDGTLTRWTADDGLPVTTVRALYEDDEGILWIGTYDGGLLRFDGARFTHVTTRMGLFNDGVFQILDDGHGSLWMSSNRGISRLRKQELNELAAGSRREVTAVAYGTAEGMRNAECNGGLWPAGIKARDGKLWFPTQDGVAVIDPAAVVRAARPPAVVIESFLLDREPIAAVPDDGGPDDGGPDDRGSGDRPLRIDPGRTTFEIGYTSPSFITPEHIRFKYRLAGLDPDWIDARTRRTAYYSHVPPGSYTFTVIAAHADGAWSSEGQTLRIVVLPPFYRTWWFTTLLIAATAGVVMFVWKRRVARLTAAHAVQQAFSHRLIASQEAERKRIAAELHDSLGQRLVVIKNLALLAKTPPVYASGDGDGDGAPARIDAIASEAHQAIADVREIAQNLRPHELDRLGLTKALTSLARQTSAASTITLTSEVDPLDGVFAKDAEVTVYRVVQESLNNVLKHSAATEASLTVRRDNGRVQIAIEDNGRGFVFAAHGSDAARREGFGLIGMSERVTLLGGRIEIRSAPGQGTRIGITFDRP